MKFLSFVRLFGERWQRGGSTRERPLRKHRSSERAKSSRLNVEALEERTLLSVVPNLPLPVITNATLAGSSGVNPLPKIGNDNTPSVSFDPVNPQKMFATWTRNDPGNGIVVGSGKYFIRVEGAYSTDGGVTWFAIGQLSTNLLDPVKTQPGPPLTIFPYDAADHPTVAFDRNENVYVLVDEHSSDNAQGSIVLQKYDFTGFAPAQTIFDKRLYNWAIQEPAFNPTLTIDTNLPSYTDPSTGVTQTDPYSNTIYVAWNTNNTAPASNPPTFNPNVIKLLASADGGQDFTTEVNFSNGNFVLPNRYANPRLAVSQGNGGTVADGQLTGVFNEFGNHPGAGDFTLGSIVADTVRNGGEGFEPAGTTGGIVDAFPTPSGGNANIPVTTTFTDTVNITDPNFVLSDLDVHMDALLPQLQEERIVLRSVPDIVNPNGIAITLLLNNVNADGTTNSGIGLMAGDNLGIISDKIPALTEVGTTFDQEATRSIRDASNPAHFSGHYQPEVSFPFNLTSFNGFTPQGIPDGKGGFKNKLNGTWTLEITDFRNDGTTPPPQAMLDWKLIFNTRLTRTGDVTVAPVAGLGGNFNAPYPLLTAAEPTLGFGPAPTIASDNTLGSNSAYQGRLYLAYVAGVSGVVPPNKTLGEHGDNTDIFLATSDDGGTTWTNRGRVNNDNAVTDGFSENNNDPFAGQITGRPQFQPDVQVDSTTGSVVVSFYDARYDASRARVARTMAASIDGGQDFASQTFLNLPLQPFDEITQKNVVLGPITDNQSIGNAAPDLTYGFGDRQALVVNGGKVFAAWSGNENQGNLRILDASTTLPAGPRIIASTMGQLQGQAVTLLNGTTMTFNGGHALSVGDVTIQESNVGSVTANFTVFLNAPSSLAVTFSYTTVDGTAVAGADYTGVSGTITIPAGQTSITIPVTILTDPNAEPNRSFTLQISNPVNAGIARAVGNGTIIDDDRLAISIGDVTQFESSAPLTNFTFNVFLSAATTQDVTVAYATADDTAKAGIDYTATSGTLTIKAGTTMATISVPVIGNTLTQPNLDFFVNLSSPINASVAKIQGVGTIVDDDGIPDVSAGDVSITIGNSGGTTVNVPVFLSFPLAQAVSVNYSTADGTAKAGTDYVAASGTLNIPAGQSSANVPVQLFGNPNSPRNRNFFLNLTISTLSNIVKAQANVTLLDNAKVPDISIGDVTLAEPSSGPSTATFTVFLSGTTNQDVAFSYATADGTAQAGVDYLGTPAPQVAVIPAGNINTTITVPILADQNPEGNRTFFVNLTNPSNGSIVRGQGLATIIDDDGTGVKVSVGDVSQFEGNVGTSNFVFPVFLSERSLQDFKVAFTTVDGTARGGVDYFATSGILTIPAGALTSTITVPVIGNMISQPNRSFSINLSNQNQGTIARAVGTGTIIDDDGLTLSVTDVTALEPGSGTTNAVFTVTLSHASTVPVTFTYATADGSAKSGVDYTGTAVPVTVTIPANSTSLTINVPVLSDAIAEGIRSFTINLSKPINAVIERGQGTGTIIDDAKLSLSVGDFTAFEGNSGTTAFSVPVFLSAAVGQTVKVNYTTVDGTAMAVPGGTDYQATSGTLTFLPGQTMQTVVVQVIGNTIPQPNRNFFVRLSNPVNASIQRIQGTETIVDDDQVPTISVGDITLKEPVSGATNANFAVFLSFPVTNNVAINFATMDDTAIAGTDYAQTSGTLTIPAGASSAIISVPVFGSTINQPNHDFFVNLSNPVNTVIARGQGTGTIINGADRSAPDGTPQLNGFTVSFDRFVDPASFTPAAVTIRYRDPNTSGDSPGILIPASAVTPLYEPGLGGDFATTDNDSLDALQDEPFDGFTPDTLQEMLRDQARLGARKFLVSFPPQTGTGTYSYAIGPNINDHIPSSLNVLVQPGSTATSSLQVSGLADLVSNATVNVTLEQGLDQDVTLTLIAPDGTSVLLSKNRGGPTGKNYFNTTFDDSAATPISAGQAPFTGSFRPEQSLGATLLNKNPNGTWTLQIQDSGNSHGTLLGWSLRLQPSGKNFSPTSGNLMDQNADGVAGEDPAATPFFGTSPGDVYAVPRPNPAGAVTFSGTSFAPPYDVESLPLIIPGPHVVKSFVDATFTPPPEQLGLVIPPSGTGGSGIPANDITTSSLVISGGDVARVINNLTVNLTLTHTNDSDLVITLIATDGTQVLLANQKGGNGQNFTNTTFTDVAGTAISAASAPFTGSFRPESPLSVLNGKPLVGTWKLQIQDTKANNTGTLVNWSLTAASSNPNTSEDITLATNSTTSSVDVVFDRDMQAPNPNDPNTFGPQSIQRILGPAGQISGPFTVTANPFGTDSDPTHPRTFRIGFPTQNLSGTYVVTFGPNIKAKNGDLVDANLNAGLDVLRDTPSAGTAADVFNSTDVGPTKTIGDPRTPNAVTRSIINVTDNFVVSSLTLQLNISYANDPDLKASLIGPDRVTSVVLFGFGTGATPTPKNFTDTIFDDTARTPIRSGGPPFTGRFSPQLPLSTFNNFQSAGIWTLRIEDRASGTLGTLNSWKLTFQKPVPLSGLGEPVADQSMATFRIFTMDPANPLSHSSWTAVGPASIAGGRSGRIGGIAVDPSDPSGNTVYIGGASGGIWKTTNFLTSDPNGPTYVPLTDFGPTFGINIGSIAIFPRNNDPRQSIIFAATGEGDTASPGVGFLRSMDGGATWTVLDSRSNFDTQTGLPLPISGSAPDGQSRDHVFVGSTSFKLAVDPHATPTGDVVLYAALGLQGNTGGVWRSEDTGRTWMQVLVGDATDIVLDPNSGTLDAFSRPTGNLQILYAALRGDGVYISPNQGQVFNKLDGVPSGHALIQDGDVAFPNPPVPVNVPGSTPSTGGRGRIVLAKPALTGDPLKDLLYEGWLYALEVTGGNAFGGLYITKDFGANWTSMDMHTMPRFLNNEVAIPTNDSTTPKYDPFSGGGTFPGQGNYDVSFAVDPLNPNIVYLGGTVDGPPTGFLRVDTTGVSDPYALFLASDRNTTASGVTDNGRPRNTVADPISAKGKDLSFSYSPGYSPDLGENGFINFLHDPFNPFDVGATVFVTGTNNFANTGAGIKWIPFDAPLNGTTDHHRLIAVPDALTGHTRLLIGDDQGIFTAVDRGDGTFINSLGDTTNLADTNGDLSVIAGSRQGNLQITQFYYGASQPSDVAAQIAALQGLFYGNAQDDGFPRSAPDVLTSGNLVWAGPGGDGSGVATDQTGTGTVYQYKWPCCGGNNTDFFQVNEVGRTSGLVGPTLPDPQWPFIGGFNFAVNPINGNQIIISSSDVTGNIYGTITQGKFWLKIGDPTTGALDGSNAPALAYGAPDPKDPLGQTNDFLYAGTNAGHIYVTFTGGGGKGNQWTNISAGLDGSGVRQIITNPNRGSHEAYAVTFTGVFHMTDSSVANATWQKISGNLFQVMHNIFTPFNEPATISPQLVEAQTKSLETIQADWRYAIPDNPAEYNNPAAPPGPTHPVLYVGGQGGVYRSIDGGASWTVFPTKAQLIAKPDSTLPNDGAQQDGGFMPNAHTTALSLALGNIDPTTGHPIVAGKDPNTGLQFFAPDVLLATTYGRGSFAIRVSPIIVPGSPQLDPKLPAPFGSNPGPVPGTINVLTPVIDGMTEQSAFSNTVRVELFDLSNVKTIVGNQFFDNAGNPVNPPNIGSDPSVPANAFVFSDQAGRFKIQVKAGYLKADGTTDGVKVFGIRPTDASGAVGQMQLFSFILDTTPFIHNQPPEAPHFDPMKPLGANQGGSDSGLTVPAPGFLGTFTDDLTNVTQPFVDGVVSQAAPTPINLIDKSSGKVIGTGQTNDQGNFSIQVDLGVFKSDGSTDGPHVIQVVAPHKPNNSNVVELAWTLLTVAPPIPPAPSLLPSSDSGFSNTDHITNVKTPSFSGTGEAKTQVQLFANGILVGNDLVNAQGQYVVTASTPLADGVYDMTVKICDFAGNLSPVSAAMTPKLVIRTKAPTVPTLQLDPAFATAGKPNTTAAVPSQYDGTSDPGTVVTIFDNGIQIDSFSEGTSPSFTRLLNLTDGQHLLTVTAMDLAGNTSTFAPANPDGRFGLEILVDRDALDPSRKFIREIYSDALGRTGSLTEWNFWLPLLNNPNGRFLVANGINRSAEARDFLVKGWYMTFLGRTAQNGEESPWVNAMVNFGLTEEQTLSMILGSAEYFNHAASIPGAGTSPSNSTFVNALYIQLLNRIPGAAEVQGWVNLIPQIGRNGVAFDILSSREYREIVVRGYYTNLLRRPTAPSQAEVDGWTLGPLDITSIRVAFESSVEFYFRVTGFMP